MAFDQPLAAQVEPMTYFAMAQLQEGIAPTDWEEVFNRGHRILGDFVDSPLASHFRAVEILARELPFTCPATWLDPRSEALMGTGLIDLVYRDADGTTVVADWKVSQSNDHEALRARYSVQLQAYARVVQAMVPGATLRAELVLVASGERIDVPL
jgi:ATP-dependent exoDNAse (exonuclease V) beta subunit